MLKPVADLLILTMVAGNTPVTEIPQDNIAIEAEIETIEEPFIIIEEPEPEVLEIPEPEPEPEQPKVVNFDYDIASYTTKYSGADSNNRNYNMHLASDSINGIILQPGESFSYNDVILKNSHNGRDYKEAGIYSNGKSTTGIGGGICQISSTLYQAALYSGMTITERKNHSLPVAYMPNGRDATASWGSIDFKFRNDLKVPVKIESVMKNGTLKVRFLAPENPNIGNIKIDVIHQADGAYVLKRTRADGTVDYTATSRYGS